MYLYIVKIMDIDDKVTYFGTFRSEENAEAWAKEDIEGLEGWDYTVEPLLDPHYIND